MASSPVSAIQPTPGTLIEAVYPQPDYRDAFLVHSPHAGGVEDFATAFFLSQPGWLARVSMNLGGAEHRHKAIGDASYCEGTAVGSWRVHGRTANEIMFGEHMGFMEYRFSVLQRDDGAIEAATSVKYLKRFAPYYFGVVGPFHRRFIRIALSNAAGYDAPSMAAQ